MNVSEELSRIRQMVRVQFDRRRPAVEQLIRETILMRDGFYCGHRFVRDELKAEWMVETGEVAFFLHDRPVAVSKMNAGEQAA